MPQQKTTKNKKKMLYWKETHAAYKNFTVVMATLLKSLQTGPLLKWTDVLFIKFEINQKNNSLWSL